MGQGRNSLGRAAVAAIVALNLGGCVGLGAERLSIDREDYVERLRESEKTQLLANIVAMRHGEAPLFLGVTSVISQYTRESSGRLDLTLSPPPDDNHGNVGGSVLLRETPTVTYTPMSGERFSRSLLTPLAPASLLAMMEAGWASEPLLRLTVRSINGVPNTSRASLFAVDPDPRFRQGVEAMGRLQRRGVVSLKLVQREKVYEGSVHLGEGLTPQDRADMALLRSVFGFRLDGQRTRLVFGARSGDPEEMAIVTRSMFEMLAELGEGIDLTGEGRFPSDALVRIHSGPKPPAQRHVAVRRQGRWYWIESSDLESQRMFLLAQVLISLSDDGGSSHGPMLTIPAG